MIEKNDGETYEYVNEDGVEIVMEAPKEKRGRGRPKKEKTQTDSSESSTKKEKKKSFTNDDYMLYLAHNANYFVLKMSDYLIRDTTKNQYIVVEPQPEQWGMIDSALVDVLKEVDMTTLSPVERYLILMSLTVISTVHPNPKMAENEKNE